MNFEICHLTGASGFIGNKLRRKLTIKIPALYAYDYKRGDEFTLDPKQIERVITQNRGKKQVIFHIGATASTSLSDVAEVTERNLDFTLWISEIASSYKIPFIFASSAAVYGRDMRTSRETNPLNYYGLSKLQGEVKLLDCYKGNISDLVVFRLFNVYGFDERVKGPMMSIPSRFILDSLSTNNINIWKVGNLEQQSRDFIFVDDVVDILSEAIERHPWSECIVDLGAGESVPFVQIASWIQSLNATSFKYVDFPEIIDPSTYQVFTIADKENLMKLRIKHQVSSLDQNIGGLLSQYRTTKI